MGDKATTLPVERRGRYLHHRRRLSGLWGGNLDAETLPARLAVVSQASAVYDGPMHYLLFYDLAPDYLERRGAFREEHLTLAWEAQARGELVLAGALADPVAGAVLLFEGDSPVVAERFAEADPYVRAGLVTAWWVRPWTTVVGDGAATPVRPG